MRCRPIGFCGINERTLSEIASGDPLLSAACLVGQLRHVCRQDLIYAGSTAKAFINGLVWRKRQLQIDDACVKAGALVVYSLNYLFTHLASPLKPSRLLKYCSTSLSQKYK